MGVASVEELLDLLKAGEPHLVINEHLDLRDQRSPLPISPSTQSIQVRTWSISSTHAHACMPAWTRAQAPSGSVALVGGMYMNATALAQALRHLHMRT